MKFFLLLPFLYSMLGTCQNGSLANKLNRDGDAFSVLVFSKTTGFYHESIPAGIEALQKMGQEHGFAVDTTKDAAWFIAEKLPAYKVVIFLNTTLDVLNDDQQAAFEKYIRTGGGFVGIHSAADTEYDWPWYGDLVGAYFQNHPAIQVAVTQVIDHNHPATDKLPDEWKREDEWYNFKYINPNIHVLCKLDESTYQGGTHNGDHPIAWYHEYDGGRAFYTGHGHRIETYSDPLFLDHLWGGIQYAAGLE